jgi:hypothetical protein
MRPLLADKSGKKTAMAETAMAVLERFTLHEEG